MEMWKSIEGYEGLYEISNSGRVRSLDRVVSGTRSGVACLIKVRGCYPKPQDNGNGYKWVHLSKNDVKTQFYIHRLVATHFCFNPYDMPEVNHEDGVKSNNHWENLTWCTSSENKQHAFDTGLRVSEKGSKHPKAKLHEADIPIILAMLDAGVTQTQTAKFFGIDRSVISRINTGDDWKHLAGHKRQAKKQ